jgi:hypothetical protein
MVSVKAWQHPNQRPASELPGELRRAPVPDRVREWVRRRAGSPVMSVRRLPGASSTAVHAVRLADGTVLVLRRYVWERFRLEEPEAPAREVEALGYADTALWCRRSAPPTPMERTSATASRPF